MPSLDLQHSTKCHRCFGLVQAVEHCGPTLKSAGSTHFGVSSPKKSSNKKKGRKHCNWSQGYLLDMEALLSPDKKFLKESFGNRNVNIEHVGKFIVAEALVKKFMLCIFL